MQDFDFDEWADLYRRDPQAFEARRQAVIALELASHRDLAGPARETLRRLDAQLQGCSDEERLPASFRFLTDSLGQLCAQMEALNSSVGTFNAALTRRACATAASAR